jgi:putative transposase
MTLGATYPIRLVCRLLGVPRSSVYYSVRAPIDEAVLKTALLDLAAQWPTYGYRRLTWMMKRLGWPVNGKRVRRWMDELNLCGAPPEKKYRTTDSRHAFPRYKNLVKDLEIVRPDQVWVADITYIRLHREFVYLAVIMDVFTRRIRGWHLSRSIDQLGSGLAVRRDGLRRSAAGPGRPVEHGGGRRAARKRLRRAADADHQRRGGGPV